MNYARIAIITGSALFAMAIVAGFSFGFAHSTLVIPHDAPATLLQLQSNICLFRSEIAGWFIIFLLDLVVAIGLCHFFRSSALRWSTAASGLRIAYSAVLGAAIVPLLITERIASGTTTDAASALTSLHHLEAFETIWSYGLMLFGVHLVVLGLANFKSSYGSNFWGSLLIIAGLGYSLVHTLHHFPIGLDITTIAVIEQALILPMTLGELGFAGWLIWKGIRMRRNMKPSL